MAFALYVQGIAGNIKTVILRNALGYFFERQVNIEYPLAVDAADMVVPVHIPVIPYVAMVEDPLDDPPVGQLVEIPVHRTEADIRDILSNLAINPLHGGVTLRTLEDFQNGSSLPAESHNNQE